MNSISNKTTFFTLDLIDLSNLFSSHYTFNYFEILGVDEDLSYASKNVDSKELDEYEADCFNNIVQQGYCEQSQIDIILSKLCHDGFIEAGDYLITN